jgi:signal transduction histidine kinase
MPRPPDHRFLSLIVHDLRNPLNAIGMALHMIDGEIPEGCDDLRQDVAMIAESARSLRKMLRVLSDYNSAMTNNLRIGTTPFDPRRLVSDIVADLTESADTAPARLHLEFSGDAPPRVELDQGLVRLALSHAIANALEAANGTEVRVIISGERGRWITRISTEHPPAESVEGGPLRVEEPQRLIGNAFERRGLELAIVARVTEILDGSARLDLEPGLRASLVLDWPVQADPKLIDGSHNSRAESARPSTLPTR